MSNTMERSEVMLTMREDFDISDDDEFFMTYIKGSCEDIFWLLP